MHRSARALGDYTGAMLAGGRWNPIGTPMLYTARHLSLACIEVLVHLDKSQLPRDYVSSSLAGFFMLTVKQAGWRAVGALLAR